MLNPKKQLLIGWLMIGGLVVIVIGFLITLMLGMSGTLTYVYTKGGDAGNLVLVSLGPLTVFIGALFVLAGLVIGFRTMYVSKHEKNDTTIPDVLVVARFGVNKSGETVFSDFDFADSQVRRYVQVKGSDRKIHEFECAAPVFDQCLEGSKGDIIVKGGWLCSFARRKESQDRGIGFERL